MTIRTDARYPGETAEYRRARDRLLQAEIDLRRRSEEVAARRRSLPLGGPIPRDYEFTEATVGATTGRADDGTAPRTVRLSELFSDGGDTLFVYGLMFHPEAERACPMCTSLLDGLDGQAPYIEQRIDMAVVAKAPAARIRAWAKARGWRNLRLLSSHETSFNRDYGAETPAGDQRPSFQVFRRTPEAIHHWYGSELLFAPRDDGMDPRHADTFWPLWGVLDFTPEGRGRDWYPARVDPSPGR